MAIGALAAAGPSILGASGAVAGGGGGGALGSLIGAGTVGAAGGGGLLSGLFGSGLFGGGGSSVPQGTGTVLLPPLQTQPTGPLDFQGMLNAQIANSPVPGLGTGSPPSLPARFNIDKLQAALGDASEQLGEQEKRNQAAVPPNPRTPVAQTTQARGAPSRQPLPQTISPDTLAKVGQALALSRILGG